LNKIFDQQRLHHSGQDDQQRSIGTSQNLRGQRVTVALGHSQIGNDHVVAIATEQLGGLHAVGRSVAGDLPRFESAERQPLQVRLVIDDQPSVALLGHRNTSG
jgi:hypothetical protein